MEGAAEFDRDHPQHPKFYHHPTTVDIANTQMRVGLKDGKGDYAIHIKIDNSAVNSECKPTRFQIPIAEVLGITKDMEHSIKEIKDHKDPEKLIPKLEKLGRLGKLKKSDDDFFDDAACYITESGLKVRPQFVKSGVYKIAWLLPRKSTTHENWKGPTTSWSSDIAEKVVKQMKVFYKDVIDSSYIRLKEVYGVNSHRSDSDSDEDEENQPTSSQK